MNAACPACVALPEPARGGRVAADLVLHLPDIHCAACIAGVEETLNALPGVREARVNLTLKRAFVSSGGIDADVMIDALARAGHRAQRFDPALLGGQDSSDRDLLLRIGVSGFAMMNVMLLSVAVWSGAAATTAHLFHLIAAMIAVPAVAYSGRPFFASALGALSARRLNMDVPISLAIVLALGVSVAGAFLGHDRAGWFDAALALTFFLLIGRYLDHRGRTSARSAAAELAALEAPQALRVEEGGDVIVRAADLLPGDIIRVRPGDRLPVDGIILEGATDLDRSALTGESQPEAASAGDTVAAGEVTLTGPLLIRTIRAGADTSLRRLAELVAAAETQKSRYAGLADRAAKIYAPVVHILGAAAFVLWMYLTAGDGWRSLDVAISVLVITCPCALGLAVPAVSTVTTSRLFRKGLLVKSSTALERLAEVDMVVFDKTGTLTTGRMRLETELGDTDLALAAGLATGSAHPVSRAICDAAAARGIAPLELSDIREIPGKGVCANQGGREIRLGRADWIGATGATALQRADGSHVAITLGEDLRSDAEDMVARLRAAGLPVVLLSGDAPEAVARLAETLGIEDAHARMSPEEKARWIEEATARGARPLMVGDGLNDTGSLALAHASIAPSSALDAARNAADLVLLSDKLGPVADAIAAARQAKTRMKENIGLAVLYNLVSIPIAFAGLATPFIAAIAMSTSSVTVSLNAARGRE